MNVQKTLYNLYCDESRHLENDHSPVMAIGYIKSEANNYEQIISDLKTIKLRHHTPVEIKWSKLSTSRIPLYKELIDYFFNNPLWFRCILVKKKEQLDHTQFYSGSPDNFYYNLVYHLLLPNKDQDCLYKVYLDIKDTRGRDRLKKIKEAFQAHHKGESPFIHFQHLHSHESPLFELVDLFIGAITYKASEDHTKPGASTTKSTIINYIEEQSGYIINEGTEPWEKKFNILDHQARQYRHD